METVIGSCVSVVDCVRMLLLKVEGFENGNG